MRIETAAGPPLLRTDYVSDALNRRINKTDAEGIVTCYEYNSFDEQTKVVEDCEGTNPRATEFHYSQLGHMAWRRATDDDGPTQTTLFDHDLAGRRTGITFCDDPAPAFDFVYDAAGRMITREDPLGQITEYTHNRRGQVLTKTVDGVLEESFAYNPRGWMTLASRGTDQCVSFGHDAFGQATSETQTVGGTSKTIGHDYTISGLPLGTTYPPEGGVNVSYGYDFAHRASKVYRDGTLLAEYDHGGRHLRDRYITTKSAAPTTIHLAIDYDNHRRQREFVNTAEVSPQPVELEPYVYTHDDVGNVETADISGNPAIEDFIDYDYDDFHRLTGVAYTTSAEGMGYDFLGNRTVYADRFGGFTTYDDNCLNEYSSIYPAEELPGYDAAGNLTRTEYGYGLFYDYEHRLVEVRDPADVVLATYTYDALGRRVTETRGGETTRFYYYDHNVIAEYDQFDRLKRYYIHGPAYVDEHILMHDDTRGDLYYLNTALFSTSGLVDRFGNVVERYSYDAYGLPAVHADYPVPSLEGDVNGDGEVGIYDMWEEVGECPGDDGYNPAANFDEGDGCITLVDYQRWLQLYRAYINVDPDNPYYFTGRRLDFDLRDEDGSVTGIPGQPLLTLYHYRARAYDPWHGRFLQRDAALYLDGSNLYEYCRSNPLVCQDPSGESILGVLGDSAVAVGTMAN